MVFGRGVADGEKPAVGRDAVIVVAMDFGSGGDLRGLAAIERKAADGSLLVEDEGFAVARPVGSFKVGGGDIFDMAIGGGDGDGFESADEGRLAVAGGSCSKLTFENTAFSTTSLLCAQTPMPT
jgi:hypothetical protein